MFSIGARFFENQRRFVFITRVLLTIVIALPLNSNLINYVAWSNAYFVFVYILLVLYKIHNREPFKIDLVSLFCLYNLFSLFFHYPLSMLFYKYNLVLIPFSNLAFYVLLRSGTGNRKTFDLAIKILIYLAVFQSITGMSQVIFEWPDFKYYGNWEPEEMEVASENNRNYFNQFIPGLFKNNIMASGTFHHFNTLGTYLILLFPIAYAYYLEQKKRTWLYMTGIIFMGIVFTFSRGALISAITSYLFLSIVMGKYKIHKVYLLIAFSVPFYLITNVALQDYAERTGNATGRYDTWVYCIEYGMKEPKRLIFGYGQGYFKKNVFARTGSVFYTLDNRRLFTNFHSMYVGLLLEYGIIGFLLYLFAIVQAVRISLQYEGVWGYCLLAILFAFSINQAFDHSFFRGNGTNLFIYLGLFIPHMLYSKKRPTPIAPQAVLS